MGCYKPEKKKSKCCTSTRLKRTSCIKRAIAYRILQNYFSPFLFFLLFFSHRIPVPSVSLLSGVSLCVCVCFFLNMKSICSGFKFCCEVHWWKSFIPFTSMIYKYIPLLIYNTHAKTKTKKPLLKQSETSTLPMTAVLCFPLIMTHKTFQNPSNKWCSGLCQEQLFCYKSFTFLILDSPSRIQ